MFNMIGASAQPECKFAGLTTALFGVVALFFYLSVAIGQTLPETPEVDASAELAVCQEALEECLRPKPVEDNAYTSGIDDLQKRIQTMQGHDPSDEKAPVEIPESLSE